MLLSLFFFALTARAEPNWAIHCDYAYAQMPFCSVDLDVAGGGQFGAAARIYMQGATHLESFTPQAPGPGERVHGWLSKESPDNSVELVIYERPTPQGDSKLTNHHVPMGQDVWGRCRSSFGSP